MRPALVTMAVGRGHLWYFYRYAWANWRTYAKRHGVDLVVLHCPLDQSPRARARSVAWQKCLTFGHPAVRRRRQVAWIDADILFGADAPSLFETTPDAQVGAVDAYGPNDCAALTRSYALWRATGVPFIDTPTPEMYHTAYGLPHGFPRVVQAGVMVVSPEAHAPLFRAVYDGYEERGGAEWNYEMRPLSWELQRANVVHWLDGQWNVQWSTLTALGREREARDAHVLHFAGCHAEIARAHITR